MPLLGFCCSVTHKQIGVDEVLLAVFFCEKSICFASQVIFFIIPALVGGFSP